MQLKKDAIHKHACTVAPTSLASTIWTVGVLVFFVLFFNFSNSRYQAAFISIRLDTIYDQLFRLVFFPSRPLPLLWLLELSDGGGGGSVLAGARVCLSPSPWTCMFLHCLRKGEVCLFCRLVAPPLTCVGVWVTAMFFFTCLFGVVFFWGGRGVDLFMWWNLSHPNSRDWGVSDTPPFCHQTVCQPPLCEHTHATQKPNRKRVLFLSYMKKSRPHECVLYDRWEWKTLHPIKKMRPWFHILLFSFFWSFCHWWAITKSKWRKEVNLSCYYQIKAFSSC